MTGRINGTIRNLGADWQTIAHDGVADLDARYVFETAEGALVEIINQGFRHGPPEVMKQLASGAPTPPDSYYMRSTARLEAGMRTTSGSTGWCSWGPGRAMRTRCRSIFIPSSEGE